MDNDIRRSWENFLNPKELRSNIIEASLFSMAYELLKQSVIDRIKDFYLVGFNEKGNSLSPSYKEKVLSLHRNPLIASLSWLQNAGAISGDDLEKFKLIRQCRNTLVHELPSYVSSSAEIDITTNFSDLIELVAKIEKWWIINVELELDPNPNAIDAKSIIPGRILFIQMLADIALGEEDAAKRYYEQFQREFHKDQLDNS